MKKRKVLSLVVLLSLLLVSCSGSTKYDIEDFVDQEFHVRAFNDERYVGGFTIHIESGGENNFVVNFLGGADIEEYKEEHHESLMEIVDYEDLEEVHNFFNKDELFPYILEGEIKDDKLIITPRDHDTGESLEFEIIEVNDRPALKYNSMVFEKY